VDRPECSDDGRHPEAASEDIRMVDLDLDVWGEGAFVDGASVSCLEARFTWEAEERNKEEDQRDKRENMEISRSASGGEQAATKCECRKDGGTEGGRRVEVELAPSLPRSPSETQGSVGRRGSWCTLMSSSGVPDTASSALRSREGGREERYGEAGKGESRARARDDPPSASLTSREVRRTYPCRSTSPRRLPSNFLAG
jgi:hypothetical protein